MIAPKALLGDPSVSQAQISATSAWMVRAVA